MQGRARYKLNKFMPLLSKYCNYIPDETIKEVYYGLIKMIGAELLKSGRVDCPDLGVFELFTRKPHMALDVKSQQLKMLGVKKQVKFRSCRKMKAHFYKVGEEEARSMI